MLVAEENAPRAGTSDFGFYACSGSHQRRCSSTTNSSHPSIIDKALETWRFEGSSQVLLFSIDSRPMLY